MPVSDEPDAYCPECGEERTPDEYTGEMPEPGQCCSCGEMVWLSPDAFRRLIHQHALPGGA